MSSRNNLSGKSKVGPQILDSLGSEVNVVVLPVESHANVVSGLKGLDKHEDLKVGGSLDVRVGGRYSVFFDNENSLTEEVLEDSNAVRLGDEHGDLRIIIIMKGQLDRSDRIDCFNSH
jgi:hypothetical protein